MILDSSEAMMLDSPSAMTSQECRYLWEILKLTYADIEPYDLDALQGYIALECAESCRKGKTPRYTIPRRKNDSLCYKMNPDGGIADSIDDAEDTARILLTRQWNARWTPSDRARMNWFRYVFLALILVCAVSLLSLLAPDSKSSDRRFRIYIASVVAVGAIICVLFQALVPTSIESAGEKTEVAGTHSLASLKTESSLSGATALSFGYLTSTDEYVLMVKQDDGGYRRRCYPAKTVVVYEDADAEDARVETVNSYEIVRLNYALPIVGEWSRNQLSFSRQETRIHVPQGSITQGEYDFS